MGTKSYERRRKGRREEPVPVCCGPLITPLFAMKMEKRFKTVENIQLDLKLYR
jgi:hypothetical protein